MMFGFGFIMMILVIGLPVALAAVLIWGLMKRPANASRVTQQSPTRICSNCGTGLQFGWTHCPQCGAAVNPAGK